MAQLEIRQDLDTDEGDARYLTLDQTTPQSIVNGTLPLPQLTSDPASPTAETAWVLRQGSGASIADGVPIGLLLALTYKDNAGVDFTYQPSYRTSGSTTLRLIHQDQTIQIMNDSKKAYFGTGKDTSLYFDGTDFNLKTDEVAASDFNLHTGTAKTLELQTPVYDDINFSVGRGKTPGVGLPNWQPFCGDSNNNAYKFGVDEYIDLGTEEMYHWWKEGTVITPHVHIVLSDTLAQDEKVQFRLYYSIGDVNGLMSAEGSVVGERTILDTTAVRTHILVNLETINLAANHIGAMIICQLHRIAKSAGGVELTDEPFVMNVGLHCQKDTIGSRQIATK